MWCTKCGKQLTDGVNFCDGCGAKVNGNADVEDKTMQLGFDSMPNAPVDPAGDTYVLQNPDNNINNGSYNNGMEYTQDEMPPQPPVYGVNDYSENKAAKASKSKAGYIIILIICLVVIMASAGVIVWTLMSDSDSSSPKGKDELSVLDDDDEDDEDELKAASADDSDEESETETTDSAKAEGSDDGDVFLDDPVPTFGESAPGYDPAPEEEEPVEEESQYLLEDSDIRRIEEAELYDFDEFECKLALNELYARHGRMFDTPEIQEYFDSKDWYHGTITASDWQNGKYDSKYFNDYEIYNRDLIAEYQKSKGWRK